MQYNKVLKKKLCEMICLNGKSTIKTAKDYNIPLKTLEKWITAYNKDNHCFDSKFELVDDFKLIDPDPLDLYYDDLSNEELKIIIMKKDIEITRLKKVIL